MVARALYFVSTVPTPAKFSGGTLHSAIEKPISHRHNERMKASRAALAAAVVVLTVQALFGFGTSLSLLFVVCSYLVNRHRCGDVRYTNELPLPPSLSLSRLSYV